MGKGGGGGVSAPKIKVPKGLQFLNQDALYPLAEYAQQLLNLPVSLGNWAANLATGGNVASAQPEWWTPTTTDPKARSTIPGAQAYNGFGQAGGGLAGLGGGGGWGGGGGTSSGGGAAPDDQAVTLTQAQVEQLQRSGWSYIRTSDGNFTPVVSGRQFKAGDQLSNSSFTGFGGALGKYFGIQAPSQTASSTGGGWGGGGGGGGGGGDGSVTASQLPQGVSIPSWQTWYGKNLGKTINVNGSIVTIGKDIGPDQLLSAYRNNQISWDSPKSTLGPFLQTAWDAINQEKQALGLLGPLMDQTKKWTADQEAKAKQLYGEGQSLLARGGDILTKGGSLIDTGTGLLSGAKSLLSEGTSEVNTGDLLLKEATTGTGLFKSQQALVDEQVKTQQAELQARLNQMGLGNSTMVTQLKGEAGLAGAATAGQLIQGNIAAAEEEQKVGQGEQGVGIAEQNVGIEEQKVGIAEQGVGEGEQNVGQQQIQLSQAASKLALGGQELSLAEQGALHQELGNIASQSAGLQAQTWTEAMQGYGLLGQIFQMALEPYGYALQSFGIQAQIATQNAANQLAASQANAQSSQAGFTSLLGGLGSLLGGGGGGGGGGGLLGGLGSAFGGIGGTLGSAGGASIGAGQAAAAALGGTAGGGGLIAGIGSALGALFCEIAREVYGVKSPKWIKFRNWLLFRAPRPLMRFYGKNARVVAIWLRPRHKLKWMLTKIMDLALI